MKDLIKSYENGNITFDLIPEEGRIYIHLLWVDEEHRRQGLGTRMLKDILELAEQLRLKVELNARGDIPTEALIGFYAGCGFELIDGTSWVNFMRRTPT